MKATIIKVSVSQDGLLPQETKDLVTLEFPVLQKKLLKALGFERVDSTTFVGVLPMFVNLKDKHQEIELELGVNLPEMRKKVAEILDSPIKVTTPIITEKKPQKRASAKKSPAKAKTTVIPKAGTRKAKAPASAPKPRKTAARKTAGRKAKGKK